MTPVISVVIYWLLCFEQVYNKRIDLLNKGSLGGRLISFALFIINRLIISGGKLINLRRCTLLYIRHNSKFM